LFGAGQVGLQGSVGFRTGNVGLKQGFRTGNVGLKQGFREMRLETGQRHRFRARLLSMLRVYVRLL